MYSALQHDFMARLCALGSDDCQVFPFETVGAFYTIMQELITTSVPCLPASYQLQQFEGEYK